MHIPISHYVYEFSYPEGMPELAGIVFYVGKGTSLRRMDNHLKEAANGCDCAKCEAIRSVWDAGLVVVRRIVFESQSESKTLNEEKRRILQHRSPYLTNKIQTQPIYTNESNGYKRTRIIIKDEDCEPGSISPFWT